MEDLGDELLLSDLFESTQCDSFLDCQLDVGAQVLVLKIRQRPEAEVHQIHHEQLQQGQFRILAGGVEAVGVEVFGRLVPISQLF